MADEPTQGPTAVLNQLKALWEKQSRGRRTLAIGVLVAVALVVLATRLINTTATWQVVADGAAPDDNQEIMAVLEQRGVQARLANNKVEVKVDDVDKARAITSAAGLPRTGKGFELFDGNHLGQSSFAEQVNFRRGLQGELARSITSLAQVQSARVHLAMGKRSVFKEQEEAATASVALQMFPGQQLTPEQVRGIRQMVAASVEGMKAESVVIVDNHGNLLDAAEPTAANKTAAIELGITGRVRGMLEKVVGVGKVSVTTTAVVDQNEVQETQELFDNSNPVLRSESRTVEGNGALDPTTLNSVGGVAGARGNLPGATPGGGSGTPPASNSATNGRLQETKNFEISRTVRQVKKPDAQLQKIYVAVVLDEPLGKDGKPVARDEKEMAELTALARQAAGIDDARGDKIDVRSIAFAPVEAEVEPVVKPTGLQALIPVPLPIAGAAAGGFVVLVLGAIFLLKGRKKSKAEAVSKKKPSLALPASLSDIEKALDAKPNLSLGGRDGEGMSLTEALPALAQQPALPPGGSARDRVLSAVKNDVDRAAEVLTAWLSEPPAKQTAVAAKGAK
ncbi:MAG TPA: flagellar basal-body MS-ring/collar protein FliF [Kofleriaceae bacterium]|jgi:flagellar M-ring protein FliF